MAMFATPRARYEGLQEPLEQPADTSLQEREQAPGIFEGDLGGAALAGLKSAGTRIAMSTPSGNPNAELAGINAEIETGVYGERLQKAFEEQQAADDSQMEQRARHLVELRPDPKTTGAAGQVLFGLADVLGLVGASAVTGRPAVVSGLTYGFTRYEEGLSEGLDPGTALGKGAAEGLGLGVGVALPAALTGRLAWRALSGAGINVATGVPERFAVSEWLKARGYDEMAQQYAPLDATTLITEAVLGAAFGGFLGSRVKAPEGKPKPEVPPSAVDAALVAAEQRHAEIDAAPGIPKDTKSRQAHAAALNGALEQIVMGRKVDIEGVLGDAGFVGARPDFDALAIIADELDRAGAGDLVAQVRALEEEARSRGLIVEPDSLESLVVSGERATSSVAGAAERPGTPIRIGGDTVPARLVLVEAADVQATMSKAENQYRDRTRVASDEQVAQIAANLDPGLLGDGPVMDYGAPVLSPDGVVIGGNGRVAAIGRAYEQGGAGAYRESLKAQFGDAVDSMQQPMLVRVLEQDVDVGRAAMLSNEGGGLRMSALEQAKVDAARLGDFQAFVFGEDGALDHAANMPFVREWARHMPQNQRAGIMDADGRLSAEGAGRLRNAILFRAYGDSPTLSRLVESVDPGSRNIAAALARVAPVVADSREAMARGDLYPIGLHDDLVSAVEKLEALRAKGTSVDEWLRQMDALGDELTPAARLLVTFLDQNVRSARAMGDGIREFYRRVNAVGSPKQTSMFEANAPDKMRTLERALEAPMYSRGPGARSTVENLTTTLRAAFGRSSDRLMQAGRVRVVQSVSDLPGGPHPADVGGMYWHGQAWIVADNTSPAQVRGRVLHEIGEHAGMRDLLGDELYTRVLDEVAARAETDPVFQTARALAEGRANRPEHVRAETLAYLIENAPDLPIVQRVLASVRQWLYRTTGGRFVDLSVADLQQMAVASLRRHARQAEVEAGGGAPWYMTLFHGAPVEGFAAEEGAPLGRLRWKYINTGEGAQAFGYGHYLAQQEWISRTRYRDRLVERKAGSGNVTVVDGRVVTLEQFRELGDALQSLGGLDGFSAKEIGVLLRAKFGDKFDYYNGGEFITFGADDPAWQVGDRIVHHKMKGDAGAMADILNMVDPASGWPIDHVKVVLTEDLANARRSLEQRERGFTPSLIDGEWNVLDPKGEPAYLVGLSGLADEADAAQAAAELNHGYRARGMGTQGGIKIEQDRVARLEASLRVIDDLTVERDGWELRDPNSQDSQVYVSEERANEINQIAFDGKGKITKGTEVLLRPDITRYEPEKPAGSLFGHVMDDAEWDKLMIWDAPMREQPDNVKAAFRTLGEWPVDPTRRGGGQSAYVRLIKRIDGRLGEGSEDFDARVVQAIFEAQERRGDPAYSPGDDEIASIMLSELGVPGHRFLDGETRGHSWNLPDARFNVVLFSDDLGRVAWKANKDADVWTSANGKARIDKAENPDNPGELRYQVTIDGEDTGDIYASIEEATRAAEAEMDGQFYSRVGDPVDETTMPNARALTDIADAEVERAGELSKGFDAAVDCAMRFGT
jgi:hypothetical protein